MTLEHATSTKATTALCDMNTAMPRWRARMDCGRSFLGNGDDRKFRTKERKREESQLPGEAR